MRRAGMRRWGAAASFRFCSCPMPRVARVCKVFTGTKLWNEGCAGRRTREVGLSAHTWSRDGIRNGIALAARVIGGCQAPAVRNRRFTIPNAWSSTGGPECSSASGAFMSTWLR